MAYSLQKTAPSASDPTAKNRVWDFFAESNRTRPANRRNPQQPRRKNSPCSYKTASGRPYWPSRDPIQEKGGVNLYGFIRNNGVNKWDVLGLSDGGFFMFDFEPYTPPKPKPKPEPKPDELENQCCKLPDGQHGPPAPYDSNKQCCINGRIISKNEKIKVKVCRRPADLPGGPFLSDVGMTHMFVVGPDGPPVGMGPIGTGGTPGYSFPGVQTELTDHSSEPQTDCVEYEVNRCKFYHNSRLGYDTGRWVIGINDCNTRVYQIIENSGGPNIEPPYGDGVNYFAP